LDPLSVESGARLNLLKAASPSSSQEEAASENRNLALYTLVSSFLSLLTLTERVR
jgi:hypothetical protein